MTRELSAEGRNGLILLVSWHKNGQDLGAQLFFFRAETEMMRFFIFYPFYPNQLLPAPFVSWIGPIHVWTA